MIVEALAFYMFAFIAVAAGVLVISSKNPVHSVLFLILAFFNAAGLFVLLGAEFLAMILVVVYVGAVAVLFMFVVMMLDINFTQLRSGFLQYLPLGALIGLILLAEMVVVAGGWQSISAGAQMAKAVAPITEGTTNTHALGGLIYTHNVYLFQAAGMILLVAMIGAIVLTLRHRKDVKRQDILAQIYRDPAKSMELKDVKPGQGL